MGCVKIFSGDEAAVESVACSPDSSLIAAGLTWKVKIFDTHTGDVFRTIPTDGFVRPIRFLDQDTVMYATNQPKFLIHNLTEKTNTPISKSKTWLKRWLRKARLGFESLQSQMLHSKTNPTDDANSLTFEYNGYMTAISSDGTRIASRTSDTAVTVWHTDGPSTNHDTTSHRNRVHSVAFSTDGQLIASGSKDRTAKLWDPTSGRCLHTFSHPDVVDFVVFSPDLTLLASVTDHQTIRIWGTHTHKCLLTLDTPRRHYRMRIGFSPNGNQLVSLGDGDLGLWEVATGKQLASVKVDRIFGEVAFGVDGTSVSLNSNYFKSVMRYRISPIQPSSGNDIDGHSSLLMQFVPFHDAQPSVSSHLCYRQGSEWIIDERKRRVLWIPPDLRDGSYSREKKAVLGTYIRRLVFVDISDVQI
jgi:WD40 repeat protein